MSIQRAPRPTQAFTVLRNDVIMDERLSYRARGVLVAILARPDHWRTDAVSLQRQGTEGREAIRASLNELETAGYLVRQRLQDERGRWRTVSVVYDEPQPTQQTLPIGQVGNPSELASKDDGSPTPGNPSSVEMASNHDGLPTPGKPAVGALGPVVRTESKNQPHEKPPGTPPPAQFAATVTRLVMEHRGQHVVSAPTVNGIARRAYTLSPSTTPEQFARAYLAIRATGYTRPNAEKVLEHAAGMAVRLNGRSNGPREDHADHWASGGAFVNDN